MEKEDTIAEMFTIRRHIRVHHTTSDGQVENRLVYQFQYIGWPDHGIPTNENTFLYFLEQVEKYQMGKSLIVHCRYFVLFLLEEYHSSRN